MPNYAVVFTVRVCVGRSTVHPLFGCLVFVVGVGKGCGEADFSSRTSRPLASSHVPLIWTESLRYKSHSGQITWHQVKQNGVAPGAAIHWAPKVL